MHQQEQFLTIGDEECLVLTDDVCSTFTDFCEKGMKVMKSPAYDPVFGMKAFVLDVSGVLIEIRLRGDSLRDSEQVPGNCELL
jgi:hypothetical protein